MSHFHFLRPYWLLAFIPLVILLWRYQHRSLDAGRWRSWCDAGLLPYIIESAGQARRLWPGIIIALVATLAIVSLAGPVWKQLDLPVFRQQSALVIVLDLSLSMDAGDIKPSRLQRARFKVIDILKRRHEGQTALVVYAGDAHVVSPLTQDSATIIDLAKILTTDLMPEQGSRPDAALKAAVSLLQQGGVSAGRVLLITDGVEQERVDKLSAIVTAAGHHLSVLAVGTEQGAPISLPGGGYLKDRTGAIVLSRLDEQGLRDLARLGGGRYSKLTTDDSDLDYLLAAGPGSDLTRPLEKTSLSVDQWREEGPWLLLIILPFAAFAFRRGYLLVIAVVMLPAWPNPAQAFSWESLWSRPDQLAARALQENKDQSPPAETFQDPAWQAAAHYRSAQYEQAVAALDNARTADEFYNKGNALARLGRLQEAIDSYDQALQRAPGHADAQYNRELVQKLFKQQQQQQQQQQSGKRQNEKRDGSKDTSRSSADSQADSRQGSGQQHDQQQDSMQRGDRKQSADRAQSDESSSASDSATTPDREQNTAGRRKEKNQGEERQDKETEQVRSRGQDHQEQAEEQQPPSAQDVQPSAPDTGEDSKQSESMQATEQWLRLIPDDPGGLLRQKFLYEYKRKSGNQENADGTGTW